VGMVDGRRALRSDDTAVPENNPLNQNGEGKWSDFQPSLRQMPNPRAAFVRAVAGGGPVSTADEGTERPYG
jgi:hypothetical protein